MMRRELPPLSLVGVDTPQFWANQITPEVIVNFIPARCFASPSSRCGFEAVIEREIYLTSLYPIAI